MFAAAVAAGLGTLIPVPSAAQPSMSPIIWKEITPGGWRLLEDYALAKANYTVGCPRDRRCRIGSGVFMFDKPRGENFEFTGDVTITVIGFGALYVQVAGDAPARIGFYRSGTMLVPIYSTTAP